MNVTFPRQSPSALKRLPEPGQVWMTRDGSKVAVVGKRRGSAPGFDAVLLAGTTVAWREGHVFVIDDNGKFATLDMAQHPLDLMLHVADY